MQHAGLDLEDSSGTSCANFQDSAFTDIFSLRVARWLMRHLARPMAAGDTGDEDGGWRGHVCGSYVNEHLWATLADQLFQIDPDDGSHQLLIGWLWE